MEETEEVTLECGGEPPLLSWSAQACALHGVLKARSKQMLSTADIFAERVPFFSPNGAIQDSLGQRPRWRVVISNLMP